MIAAIGFIFVGVLFGTGIALFTIFLIASGDE